uniref:protein SRC2 homolog n=1 Tax=Erigeron canadensis TaxID=72917 RepID=UPI001CB8D61F|nr:protein SRC2 homolog [Erigeron canadensis]
MSTTHRPPPKPLDLEITIVSAKHLKNVNWRNGDLKPYAIFWLDPDRRLATKSDDSNSTKPVWNERFLIPIPNTPSSAPIFLTLEIFHSKPSDTPKPLVGTFRLPIDDLPNPEDSALIRTFDLRRPSGRLNGKIKLKLSLRERPLPDYQIPPQPSYYYQTAPPPPPPPSYGRFSPSPYSPSPPPSAVPPPPSAAPPPPPYHYGSYSDPYSGYYQSGYYSQPPPPPPQQTPRMFSDRPTSYGGGSVGGGPSAPVEYDQFDQKQKAGKVGSGLGVGAVAGGLGGLTIDEGLRYDDDKVSEKVESDLNARELDDYAGYRRRMDY